MRRRNTRPKLITRLQRRRMSCLVRILHLLQVKLAVIMSRRLMCSLHFADLLKAFLLRRVPILRRCNHFRNGQAVRQ